MCTIPGEHVWMSEMYEISAKLSFSAGHFHPGYHGKCRNLHGHNYKVKVFVRADKLDDMDMVCDFYLIKKETEKIAEEFDHAIINDHPDFKNRQPSTENLAEYFFNRLLNPLDDHNHWLHAVEVQETDRYAARYERDYD